MAGAGAAVLSDVVRNRNEATLAELADTYRERTGIGVSLHAVWPACNRLGLMRKKRRLGPAEQARADVASEWAAAATPLTPEDLVFLDESGVATNMARLYGRAPRGASTPAAR